MKKYLLILLAVLIFIPVAASAFVPVMFNNTDKTRIYEIYWLDHPYVGIVEAPLALGEIKAGIKSKININYKQGIIRVSWRDMKHGSRRTMKMEIRTDEEIIFTPDGKPYCANKKCIVVQHPSTEAKDRYLIK